MEENQFNTDGIIKWEEDIEEIRNFIRQTDGQRVSKEQYDKIVELIKNSSSENIEITTL